MWTKLIAAEAIAERVRAAGRQIARDYAGVARPPLSGAALPLVGLWSSFDPRQRTPAGAEGVSQLPRRGLLLVGLLQGGLYFLADLARAVPLAVETATMRVRSYAGTGSTGQVEVVDDLRWDVAGRDVLVVDDVYDSGRTLSLVRELLQGRGARSVEFACLLVKDAPRAAAVEVKYGLFAIPNVYVVGAGLDLDGLGRNLPDVWALREGATEGEAAMALRELIASRAW